MRETTSVARWVVLASMVGVAAGCAVLRVDVDVYKGPLANDESVQVQQLAVAAQAAKPLLVRLRDELEWSGCRGKNPGQEEGWYLEAAVGYVRKHESLSQKEPDAIHDAKSGLCRQPLNADGKNPARICRQKLCGVDLRYTWDECPGPQCDRFLNARAKRVNAILTLYDDKDVQKNEFSQYKVTQGLEKAKRALPLVVRSADAESTLEILGAIYTEDTYAQWFRDKLMPGAQVLCDELKDKAKSDCRDKAAKLVNKPEIKEGSDELYKDKHKGYRDALKEFLIVAPKDRSAQNLVEARRNFQKAANRKLYEENEKIRKSLDIQPVTIIGRPEASLGLGGNGVAALPLEELTAFDEIWSEKDDFAKSLFVEEKRTVAAGLFDEIVKARHEAGILAIQGIDEAFSEALSVLAQVNTGGTSSVERLAHLIAGLVDAEVLASTLNNPALDELARELRGRSKRWYSDEKSQRSAEGSGPATSTKELEDSLADALSRKPNGVANQLRVAHELIKMQAKNSIDKTRGILWPPGKFPGLKAAISELPTTVAYLPAAIAAVGSALGLEGGRIDAGIERLQFDYVNLSDQIRRNQVETGKKPTPDSAMRLEGAQIRLTEALVQFSEKLRSLADNEILLEDGGISDEVTRYVRVLQALGNSIQVQANELHVRSSHDAAQNPNRAKLELEAAKQALRSSGSQFFERLFSDLERKILAQKELAAAAENESRKLQAQLNAALAKLDATNKTIKGAETWFTNAIASGRRLLGLYRTMAGENASLPNNLTMLKTVEIVKKMSEDSEGLKTDVETIQGVTTKTAVANKIVTWLQAASEESNQSADRKDRIDSAQAYLKVDPNWSEVNSSDLNASAIYARFRTSIKEKWTKEANELDKAAGLLDGARKLNADKDTQEAIVAASTQSQTNLGEILEALSAATTEIRITTPGMSHSADTARDRLLEALDRKRGQGTTKDQQIAMAAINFVRTVSAPSPALKLPSELANAEAPKKPSAVLDELIAVLQHELIQAQRAGSSSNVHVQSLKNAIQAAYDYRSGMIYIRPPTAYLRTSYAASTLQGESGVGWENMLTEQTGRNMSLAGSDNANGGSKGVKLNQLRGEIDKQFWQTINTVRLAGAGNTNYVVVKDDIGNWYVKGYDTDPGPIVESAMNLAKYAYGAKLNTNLMRLNQLQIKEAAGTLKPEEKTDLDSLRKGGDGSLSELFNRYENRYVEDTVAQLGNLKKRLDPDKSNTLETTEGLEEALALAWLEILSKPSNKDGPVTTAQLGNVLAEKHPDLSAILTSLQLGDQPATAAAGADEAAKAANRNERKQHADSASVKIAAALAGLVEYRERLNAAIVGNYGSRKDTNASNLEAKQKEVTEANAQLKEVSDALNYAANPPMTSDQKKYLTGRQTQLTATRDQAQKEVDSNTKWLTDLERQLREVSTAIAGVVNAVLRETVAARDKTLSQFELSISAINEVRGE